MLELIILISCGTIIGIVSSLFGIGGGSLLVPALFIFYPEFIAPEIISISLAIILINTVSNSYQFYRHRMLPPVSIIVNFFIASIIGAYIGTLLANQLDKDLTQQLIGVLLLSLVIRSIVTIKYQRTKIKARSPRVDVVYYSLTGIIGTILATITGLGGGVIFTPAFQYLLKVPVKKIPAYSNIAMMFGCIFGLIPHLLNPIVENKPYYLGNINLQVVAFLSVFALMGTRLGVKLNDKISNRHKTVLLNGIFLLLAIKLLVFNNN